MTIGQSLAANQTIPAGAGVIGWIDNHPAGGPGGQVLQLASGVEVVIAVGVMRTLPRNWRYIVAMTPADPVWGGQTLPPIAPPKPTEASEIKVARLLSIAADKLEEERSDSAAVAQMALSARRAFADAAAKYPEYYAALWRR